MENRQTKSRAFIQILNCIWTALESKLFDHDIASAWERDKQNVETILDQKFWKRRDIFNEWIKVLLSWSHPFFDPNLKILPVMMRGGRPTLYISVSTPNFFPLPFHFLIIYTQFLFSFSFIFFHYLYKISILTFSYLKKNKIKNFR